MKIYRTHIPSHVRSVPLETSVNDAPYGAWRNLAEDVWKKRNPSKSWEEAAAKSYPVVSDLNLAGKINMRLETVKLCLGFALKALTTGERGTHSTGIGARGKITVVTKPDIPEHEFFRPGRGFDCRLRHANGSFEDDAGCTLRGCSLKFADRDFDSPLDVIMNSGTQGPLWNVDSFVVFAKARLACHPETGDFEAQAKLMDGNPAYLVSWIESVRDAPESFADLTYTSQVVFPFIGKDGVLRYCRYRLRRPDLERESGLPDEKRQYEVWNMLRNPANDLPTDYLRSEFASRLKKVPIEYMLQIQVRDADAVSDTLEIFHLNRPWDVTRWPWKDLARVSLNQPMAAEETERTAFSLGHQPEGLGVFHAYSAHDYRSVAWARLRIYQIGQLARFFRGQPKGFVPSQNESVARGNE